MIKSATENAKKSFLSGVAFLFISAISVKLIGLFYKIPLIRLVGIEGMAYFLAAYHVYVLLFTVSNAGLPIAVSILVSRRCASNDEAGAETLFFTALKLFSIIGAVCGFAMYFLSDTVAASIKMPEAALSVRAIAPSLFFVSVASAVRGYFQGKGDMVPTAVSQVIESIGKLVLGLVFAGAALYAKLPLPVISAAAIGGISAGSALSAIYLFAVKAKKTGAIVGKCRKEQGNLFRLLRIAAPITISSAVISLTGVVDTALVSSRLQAAGIDSSVANSMYSSYGNLAIPLFSLVPSLISPIAVAVTPMLARAREQREREKEKSLISSALRITALISVPASFGLALFGEQILFLLYPSQTIAVAVAAPLLSVLAPSVLFSCLLTVLNSVLQAYGLEKRLLFSIGAGMILKIAVEYISLSNPKINIFGAPMSTLFCNLLVVCINLYMLMRVLPELKVTFALKPLSAALPATAAALLTFYLLLNRGADQKLALFAAIFADVAFYGAVSIFNGSIAEEDLGLLPGGEKIIKIMKKLRLLRNENEQRRKNNFIEGQRKI